MITDDIRQEKKEDLDALFLITAAKWGKGEYIEASRLCTRMRGFSDAFRGLDSDLFWYGVRLERLYAEFMTSESPSFEAFAMGQACEAFKGLSVERVAA